MKYLATVQGHVGGKWHEATFVYDSTDEAFVDEARHLLLNACGDVVFDGDPHAYAVRCVDGCCDIPHEFGERVDIHIEAKR